jgi:A/G-specific adenine glycosylase
MQDFSARLIAWQRRHGRHDLPWQVADAYRIWLSEIMLQQTQVETVIPYYLRFLQRFPEVARLAGASQDEVLALWSGLGYYARARNLHAAARRVVAEHGGRFPDDFDSLVALPGIGRSTAAAIAVFARGERRAILDGNVKRVLCRVFGVEGWPGEGAVEKRLWRLAEALLPDTGIAAYTQGLMDLGATLCARTRPDCPACPYADDCLARRQGRVAELPAPRPRRGLPEKATCMLVLRHGGALLFEKRPASGLWGGLWTFPECPAGGDAEAAARVLGYAATPAPWTMSLTHAFSHFRLAIEVRLLRVARLPSRVEAPGRLWLTPEDALDAALPTPARKIVGALLAEGGA